MSNSISFFQEAKKVWNQSFTGQILRLEEAEKALQEKIIALFSVGDAYFMIFDLQDASMRYVSEDVAQVLGYPAEDVSIELLLDLMHPEDKPYFLRNESIIMEYFARFPVEKKFDYKVRCDYRFKHKNGHYVRLLNQTIVFEMDEQGALVSTMIMHTDISQYKKTGAPVLSIIGMNGEPSYENIQSDTLPLSPVTSRFTAREQEILIRLIDGKISKQIAAELFISVETVNTHRRNMLSKCGAMNTPELIKLSIENAWI